jgi:hypothetical protein
MSFLSYVQLPFVGIIVFLSASAASITCALKQAWSHHRLVEVALKVVAPIVLTLGAWVPLVFEPAHTDPFGVALIACLLLRIIMFTNKVHSMQTGGTGEWAPIATIGPALCNYKNAVCHFLHLDPPH